MARDIVEGMDTMDTGMSGLYRCDAEKVLMMMGSGGAAFIGGGGFTGDGGGGAAGKWSVGGHVSQLCLRRQL